MSSWPAIRCRTKASESHGDKPSDRGLGRQTASRAEGMEAVTGQFVCSDVIPEVAGRGALIEQILKHVAKLMLRVRDVLIAMQECRYFDVVVAVSLVGDERIGLKHGLESLANVAHMISDFGQICEMTRDLTLVPSEQDRVHA